MATIIALLIVLLSAQDVLLQSPENYRLPINVRPTHYDLTFTFNPNVFAGIRETFDGLTEISLNVTEQTSVIQLHLNSAYIHLQEVQGVQAVQVFQIVNGNRIVMQSFYVENPVTEILTITTYLNLNVSENQYILSIKYEANISTTDLHGVYRSSYVDADGNIKYILSTQFQHTFARRAFPCFDEPSFKATFTLKFFTDARSSVKILANTNTANDVTGPVLRETDFLTTPVMSTYLVAFVASEFTCSPGQTVDGVENNVCSKKEDEGKRAWAVEMAPKILAAMNDYTQINYNYSSMNKLDQVALIELGFVAMENWGLSTYSEKYLLYDPQVSSNSDKESVVSTLTHEIAHQWFGNLVTAQWWSELFLNEGFANYYQYFATHMVLPDWQMDRKFVTESLQSALRADEGDAMSLQSSVSSPTEIQLMFNPSITYSKGGSILRMIEHIMGPDNFKTGVNAYLDLYKFRNTVPEDLWEILQENVDNSYSKMPEGVTLTNIMENWVKTSGFPLVSVTLNNGLVTVDQKQLLSNGSSSTTRWYVPISFTISNDANKFQTTNPQQWLTPDASPLVFNITPSAEWIILNNQQTGYYRVNYDPVTWDAIERALKAQQFSNIREENRAGIVNDLFTLARIGEIKYSRILRLLEFLKQDVSYFSWFPAFKGFADVLQRVGRKSELGGKLSQHILSLMETLYESIPFETIDEDNQIYTLKQTLALDWACRLGHNKCVESALNSFLALKTNSIRPNKNLRDIVYCTAMRESTDHSDWEFLLTMYSTSSLASEKELLLSSLTCSRNEINLERLLEDSLSNETISSQDIYTIFQNIAMNPDGINIARKFFMDRYEEISQKYQSLNVIEKILYQLAKTVTTQQELDELREFINGSNLSPEHKEQGAGALTIAEKMVNWLLQYEEHLREYFEPLPEPEAVTGQQPCTTAVSQYLLVVSLIYMISTLL